MHPSKKDLRLFVEGSLQGGDQHSRIDDHVRDCVFCSEICNEYRLYSDSVESVRGDKAAAEVHRLAEEQYLRAIAGVVIDLKPIMPDVKDTASSLLLAADGEEEFSPPILNIATLYSDNPEIVLRVMRDSEKDHDYLQLVSADPALVSHVLVRIPEQDREFLTDSAGKAVITGTPLEHLGKLRWQVKMPNAAFSLEPLDYDPEAVEYSKDIVLETQNKDRIRIKFEGKTEGKQITISILEMDGKTEFDTVKVTISQNDIAEVQSLTPNQTVTFDLTGEANTIKIRLFN
jgi:hypothetical protein